MRLRSHRRSLVELASSLVSTPSENPGPGAAKVQLKVEEYLEGLGVTVTRHTGFGGEFALTATLGEPGPDALILYGHSDVVPAGDTAKWLSPPFEPKVSGGKLYGRGASDMKAGLAAELFVFGLLAQSEPKLERPITLVCVPDEEDWKRTPTGWGFSKWLLEEGRLRGSACIMGEPSGLGAICIGERGDYWFRLRAEAEAGHGSAPIFDQNVFVRLFRALEDIHGALNKMKGNLPHTLKNVVAHSYRVIAQDFGLTPKQARRLGLLEKPTINVGKVWGGTMVNTLPDRCEAEVAACVPLGLTWRQLHLAVKQTLASHPAVSLEVEEGSQSDPSYTDPGEKIVGQLERCATQVLGHRPALYVTQATSDANVFRAHHIPTCFYGPGNIRLAHAYNEHVEIGQLIKAAEIYLRTALSYCAQ